MPRSSWVRFLNQLLPVNSCQLQAQDCNTTVAGSECGTITHVEGEEEADSIFEETEAPLIQLPCLGFEDLQDWSGNIVLKTSSSPLVATPRSFPPPTLPSSIYLETLYVYVQALFAKDNKVTPIHLGACYHGSYNAEQLMAAAPMLTLKMSTVAMLTLLMLTL
ncbi:hypothetical protein DSO57_1031762 [Entomophthora muscae]|uniref:Uncharacterized protein n=1 Tax=Entomophthora muscae TaxID=34485 RepID=A0ACC2UM99_9FUNG|nr:hypothetical protein DSO57_1031762 [Entomophthora muscae]